jgi:predicted O-methyltransferase YrrM
MAYKDKVRSLLARLQLQHATTSGRRSIPSKLYDVTAGFVNIDGRSLDIIQTAPIAMSAAERLLLYTFAFTTRPQRYLEIGTLSGGSALIVCAAMDTLGTTGTITCVDPKPMIAPEHWSILSSRTRLIEGYSPKVLKDAANKAGGHFGLVLVDGDHTTSGALNDLIGVLSVCEPSAYIMCHDCINPSVERAIDKFVASYRKRVIDLGTLTREMTIVKKEDGTAGANEMWGGLRVLQVKAA